MMEKQRQSTNQRGPLDNWSLQQNKQQICASVSLLYSKLLTHQVTQLMHCGLCVASRVPFMVCSTAGISDCMPLVILSVSRCTSQMDTDWATLRLGVGCMWPAGCYLNTPDGEDESMNVSCY